MLSPKPPVGPPRRLKWFGSPRWSRHHDRMASMSALVSGKYRLFYLMDDGSRISIQLPSKWTLVGRDAFNGVIGAAMRFPGGKTARRNSGSIVRYHWTEDIPLLARAMAMAKSGDNLIVVGPPDLMDEEETFVKLTEGDKDVEKLLARQDAALLGEQGAILWSVSTEDGAKKAEIKIPALPVWDGMAIANERLFIATTDGKVLCYGE